MPDELDLPEPEDDFDRKVLSDIREYGWHGLRVATGAHPEHAELEAQMPPDGLQGAPFTYTIGLWQTRDHPELIIVGDWQAPRRHGAPRRR